ncbi:MAG TPA: heme ABC transporter ATP-binding protein [Mycobacteriales bacterium]|nr:heme ABC transporter ATP-binding protein [Mycobacteriales bacterium]
MTPVARLVAVAARRGRRTVLADAHLDVRRGELVAVVGPNGAGKSSLLHVLAGDLPASSGSVEVDGVPIGAWSARDLAQRRAVLPQAHTVAFPFSVLEVVRMGRAPWHGTCAAVDDDAAVGRALQTVQLTELAARPFSQLSGGEQARAALARVLAQETPLVLLDEPTAALDLHHAEQVLRHARTLADAGRSVVAVLHDLDLAGAHADRVVLVGAGRLVAVGGPEQVLSEALLSQTYGADVEVLRHPRTGSPLVLPRR